MDVEDREEILDTDFADELELEDVVNSMEYVYKILRNSGTWEQIEDHVSYLKYSLREKSKKHDQYQTSHGYWQNKLAVIHCRKPHQRTFVTAIWDLILAVEKHFFPDDSTDEDDLRTVLQEVENTGEECGFSARCFPLGHLVYELECLSWNMGTNPEMVQSSLIYFDVPFKKLYAVYRKLYFFDDELEDCMEGLPAHFLKAFASLIQSFVKKHRYLIEDYPDRQAVLQQCIEDVQSFSDTMFDNAELYSRRLLQRYRRLNATLEYLHV